MSLAPLPSASPAGNPQQLTQLNQLVSKYKGDISRQVSPQVLASLARQITSDERTVGVHVVLPRDQTGGTPAPGKINVTA